MTNQDKQRGGVMPPLTISTRFAADAPPERYRETCAAIRACLAKAHKIAAEADTAGLHATAIALRRKATKPRAGDIRVTQLKRAVKIEISAYGVNVTVKRYAQESTASAESEARDT